MVGTETAYQRLSREERAAWCPYMMDSLMRVMEEAQRIDMKLAIEPVYWHPLADLETTLKTIRMVDDPEHLRLIFDAPICWNSRRPRIRMLTGSSGLRPSGRILT